MGKGAFSQVNKCANIDTGEVCAVKIITKGLQKNEKEYNYLEEIQILQSMEHPNVIRMIEYIESENQIFIVTELVNEGNLLDFSKKTKN